MLGLRVAEKETLIDFADDLVMVVVVKHSEEMEAKPPMPPKHDYKRLNRTSGTKRYKQKEDGPYYQPQEKQY